MYIDKDKKIALLTIVALLIIAEMIQTHIATMERIMFVLIMTIILMTLVDRRMNVYKSVCPRCGSTNTVKSGTGWKNKQRYTCKYCWRTFTVQ